MKNIQVFKSVAELSATLLSQEATSHWSSPTKTRNSPNDTQWAGESFETAFDKLSNGDQVNASKIKAQGDILAKGKGKGVPKFEYGVVGCLPSVPNFLRGVPKNMLNVKREPHHKPIIDIYVDSAIYDGIDVNKVAAFTARLANVIYATERAGVRVNLYDVCVGKDGRDVYGFVVKIKEASSPLNLLNIAFPIMNRAMCRKVLIHWIECNVGRYVWGHGCVLSGKEVKDNVKKDGVYFSTTQDINLDIEGISKRINEYINQKNK